MIPRLVAALIILLAAGGSILPADAFVVVVNPICRHHGQVPGTETLPTLHHHHHHHSVSSSVLYLQLLPSSDSAHDRIMEHFTTTLASSPSSTPFFLLLAADDSGVATWRQYVPLVVIGLVLLDILLGSPAANSLLAPLKQADPNASTKKDKETAGGGSPSVFGSLLGRNNNADAGWTDDNNNNNNNTRKERIDTGQVARAAIDKARNTLELKRFLEENKSDWQRMNDIKKKLDAEMESLDEELEERGKDLEERSQRSK
jgi:hypothetical protein